MAFSLFQPMGGRFDRSPFLKMVLKSLKDRGFPREYRSWDQGGLRHTEYQSLVVSRYGIGLGGGPQDNYHDSSSYGVPSDGCWKYADHQLRELDRLSAHALALWFGENLYGSRRSWYVKEIRSEDQHYAAYGLYLRNSVKRNQLQRW